jgi:hypothetical protein
MATATAMANGDGNGNGNGNRLWLAAAAIEMEMTTVTAMAIAMATSMATVIMTKGRLPLYVPAMCSIVAWATPCLHPHGDTGKCIHQCCIMVVTLLRVFAPF